MTAGGADGPGGAGADDPAAPGQRPEPQLPASQGPETALAPQGQDAAGTPVLDVPREQWHHAAAHARDAMGMDYLDWLSAVDQPDGDPPGVDVVLHLADSGSTGGPRVRRILLRTRVPDAEPQLASLTDLWPGVAWHERETFEMFGVGFGDFTDLSGHGLRPLLLPEGFEGTPLRKSFVLAARVSRPWPGAKEPGESDAQAAPSRRRMLPPGVPDPSQWGPRAAGEPLPEPDAAPAGRPARARPAGARPAGARPAGARPAGARRPGPDPGPGAGPGPGSGAGPDPEGDGEPEGGDPRA